MPSNASKKAPKIFLPPTHPVTIAEIGFGGDGVARWQDGFCYVPGTVPGDVVELAQGHGQTATLKEIITPGPGRVTPPCPQANACGGCNLQMVDLDLLDGIKRDWVVTALRHQGLAAETVGTVQRVNPGSRRRAELAARRIGNKLYLGFHGMASHRIVDIDPCLVLAPALIAALPSLRLLAEKMLQPDEKADLHLTTSSNGLDIVITRRRPLDLDDREIIAILAEQQNWARVSWRHQAEKEAEPVITARAPLVEFGDISVPLPPASFLQASPQAEKIMADVVLATLSEAKIVADLFCGLGSFALRLATARSDRRVIGIDANVAAINALQQSLRQQQLTSRVDVIQQDLFRQTPTQEGMKKWGGVVFDPPRAGATLVAGAFAKSSVPVVVAVSCNPATMARDLKIMVDGGYRLESMTIIDQFLWSAHIEAVAVLLKKL